MLGFSSQNKALLSLTPILMAWPVHSDLDFPSDQQESQPTLAKVVMHT